MELNNELLEQWEPKIHKILQTTFIVGMDREDVAQELRIAIVKAATHFDDSKGVSFHTYLHTVMINSIRTLISKAKKTKEIIEAYSIDGIYSETDGRQKYDRPYQSNSLSKALEDDSAEFTAAVELRDILERADLSLKEQSFLELRMDGLTMEQISRNLDDSAYKLRAAIQKKLRTSLKGIYVNAKKVS